MYDAWTVANQPDDGDLYAGYVDGGDANNAAQTLAAHPNRKVLTITVNGRTVADVGDCEYQDLSPQDAADEVRAGRIKIIYCNLSTWPDVRAAMGGQIPPGGYWIADYVAAAPTEIPSDWVALGAYAWQWRSNGYDQSLVADYWPTIDPEDDDMLTTDDDRRAWVREVFNRELGREPTSDEQMQRAGEVLSRGKDPVLGEIRDSAEALEFRTKRGW